MGPHLSNRIEEIRKLQSGGGGRCSTLPLSADMHSLPTRSFSCKKPLHVDPIGSLNAMEDICPRHYYTFYSSPQNCVISSASLTFFQPLFPQLLFAPVPWVMWVGFSFLVLWGRILSVWWFRGMSGSWIWGPFVEQDCCTCFFFFVGFPWLILYPCVFYVQVLENGYCLRERLDMGIISTILGVFGFGIGISIGVVIGYFLFIYSQPTDVKVCFLFFFYCACVFSDLFMVAFCFLKCIALLHSNSSIMWIFACWCWNWLFYCCFIDH